MSTLTFLLFLKFRFNVQCLMFNVQRVRLNRYIACGVGGMVYEVGYGCMVMKRVEAGKKKGLPTRGGGRGCPN